MGRGMRAGKKSADQRKNERVRAIQRAQEVNRVVEEARRILSPEVDKTLVTIKNAAYTSAIIAARECFGFGKQRLVRFAACMDEKFDSMGDAGEDWEYFFYAICKQTGLKETDFVREDFKGGIG